MRRFKQELSKQETECILTENTSGVLSVLDADGYPYGVPLSYVFINDSIYFHCAKEGRKISAIKNCDKASFCVIDTDEVQPEKFTTFYKSAIAFGKVSVLADENERLAAIYALGKKYCRDFENKLSEEIDKAKARFEIIKLEICCVTGKQCKEFVLGNKTGEII